MMEFKIILILFFNLIYFKLNYRLILIIIVLLSFIYFNLMIKFDKLSEFYYRDPVRVSLVIISLYVIYFILLSFPSVYKKTYNSKIYYGLIFIFAPLIYVRFILNNILFFYIVFETSLIPTFFLIRG